MSEKLYVQKMNKVLEIPAERLKEFMDKGYNQIDEQGKIIKEAIPNDIGMLRIKYLEHIKKIDEQAEIITKLKNQLAKEKKNKTE